MPGSASPAERQQRHRGAQRLPAEAVGMRQEQGGSQGAGGGAQGGEGEARSEMKKGLECPSKDSLRPLESAP